MSERLSEDKANQMGCGASTAGKTYNAAVIPEMALNPTPTAFQLIHNCDIKALSKIVNAGNVNMRSERGDTLLNYAITLNDKDVVAFLLSVGADCTVLDVEVAKQNRFTEISKLLENAMDKKAEADKINKLIECCIEGTAEQVEHMLTELYYDEKIKVAALSAAAMMGNDQVVEYLLNKGVNLNGQDENGMTALHFAANDGHSSSCSLLLARGANINIQTNDGATALFLAARGGFLPVCRLLLENNADFKLSCKQSSPLDIAKSKKLNAVISLLEDFSKENEIKSKVFVTFSTA